MSTGSYVSNLTDNEWKLLSSLMPCSKGRGRRPVWQPRLILDAIFYVLRGGIAWRALPVDFPPWETVYYHFRRMCQSGVWEQVNATLRAKFRVSIGRTPDAHAAIIDSQSAKATESRSLRGFDGNKKVNGRKRHILVDTLGLLLKVVVHPASLVDREGGKLLVEAVKGKFPQLETIWADQGYTGQFKSWAAAQLQVNFVVVYPPWRQMKRYFPDVLEQQGFDPKAFHVIPRRWVVERTFAWLGRNRRLSKDYETLPASEETWCYLAMSRILLKRLAP